MTKIIQKIKKTNKIMHKLLVSLVFLTFFSCNKKEKDKIISPSSSHYGYQMELKEKIVCKGDIKAYQELFDIYSDNWILEDMLSYSIIMANKYDYSQAYYDVFYILSSIPQINANICVTDECSEIGFKCLDNKTKEEALKYFEQAIYKGNERASVNLLDVYSKGKDYPIKELYENRELIEKAKESIKKSK